MNKMWFYICQSHYGTRIIILLYAYHITISVNLHEMWYMCHIRLVRWLLCESLSVAVPHWWHGEWVMMWVMFNWGWSFHVFPDTSSCKCKRIHYIHDNVERGRAQWHFSTWNYKSYFYRILCERTANNLT